MPATTPTPEPEAASSADVSVTAMPVKTTPVEIVQAIKELIPPTALSGALIVMLFTAVPTANHDPVTIIISGFLGYLTGRAAASRATQVSVTPQPGA